MRLYARWTRHAHAATKELEQAERAGSPRSLPRRWQPVFSLPAEFILIYCVAAKEMYCCDVLSLSADPPRTYVSVREGGGRNDRSNREEKEIEKLKIFLRYFCDKIRVMSKTR